MSNARTLANLIVDIREEGDLEDLEDRHPDAELIRFINRSWRRLRAKLASVGFPVNRTSTSATALPTAAPTADEQYLEVDYPSGAVAIYGVDVLDRGKWWPLKPGTFAERRDYITRDMGSLVPHTWVVANVSNETVDDDGVPETGKIQLYPLSTGGANYKIWYLPAWVDVTDTADSLYGHDMHFDWLINDVIVRVAKKDDDSQNTYAIASTERDRCWEEIKRSARNLNLAEPIRPVRRSRIW